MRAMLLRQPRPATSEEFSPLELTDVPIPRASENEVLIGVSVCGVCRTDLDVAEGRVEAPRYPVVPGHQVVGRVAAVGHGVTQWREGDRVRVAWIHSACGVCRWCTRGA